jgi:type IV pilus assembly protein PilW
MMPAKLHATSTNQMKQSGVTLIELMIGMLVGIIVLGSTMAFFSSSVESQTDNIRLTRLNQDLRSLMDIMARDIRRAGFSTSTPDSNWASVNDNPFFAATTDIAIYNTGSCIVYSYNRDDDDDDGTGVPEVPSVVDSNEFLGFRLNGTTLQMRNGGGSTNANCTDGSWQAVTDSDVSITALTFTMPAASTLNVTSMITDAGDGTMVGDDDDDGLCDTGEACNTCITGQACLYVRTVDISITGQLADDAAVTQTVSESIRIRNDKYLATAP